MSTANRVVRTVGIACAIYSAYKAILFLIEKIRFVKAAKAANVPMTRKALNEFKMVQCRVTAKGGGKYVAGPFTVEEAKEFAATLGVDIASVEFQPTTLRRH